MAEVKKDDKDIDFNDSNSLIELLEELDAYKEYPPYGGWEISDTGEVNPTTMSIKPTFELVPNTDPLAWLGLDVINIKGEGNFVVPDTGESNINDPDAKDPSHPNFSINIVGTAVSGKVDPYIEKKDADFDTRELETIGSAPELNNDSIFEETHAELEPVNEETPSSAAQYPEHVKESDTKNPAKTGIHPIQDKKPANPAAQKLNDMAHVNNQLPNEPKEATPNEEYKVVVPLAQGQVLETVTEPLSEWKNQEKDLNPAKYYNPNAYYYVTKETGNAQALQKNPTHRIDVPAKDIIEHATKRAAVEAKKPDGLISETRYKEVLQQAYRGHDLKLNAREVIAFGLVGYNEANSILEQMKAQNMIKPVDFEKFKDLSGITKDHDKAGRTFYKDVQKDIKKEVIFQNKAFRQIMKGKIDGVIITKEKINLAGLKNAAHEVAKDNGLVHVERYKDIIENLKTSGQAALRPEEAVAFGIFHDKQALKILDRLELKGDITHEQRAENIEKGSIAEKQGNEIFFATKVNLGIDDYNLQDAKIEAYIKLDQETHNHEVELPEFI